MTRADINPFALVIRFNSFGLYAFNFLLSKRYVKWLPMKILWHRNCKIGTNNKFFYILKQ